MSSTPDVPTPSASATVRPWQSLASLGVTDSEATAVYIRPRAAFRFLSAQGVRHGQGAQRRGGVKPHAEITG